MDRKPKSWEERLILFVGYLTDREVKSSTVKSYISAIKSVLRDDGESLNEDVYLLSSLTRACRYKNDKICTRLPIKKNLLCQLIVTIPNLYTAGEQPYLVTLYQTMFLTAYFGLFRPGEITASPHCIKARDVHIGSNKRKLSFVLHTSKTHWKDVKLQIIKINGSEFDPTGKRLEMSSILKDNQQHLLCPFTMIKYFVDVCKQRISDDEEFFIFRDRSPVTAEHMHLVLKNSLQILGLDADLYNLHSFRIGHCGDLYDMGVSVETIKKLGRWKSSIVYNYLKQ